MPQILPHIRADTYAHHAVLKLFMVKQDIIYQAYKEKTDKWESFVVIIIIATYTIHLGASPERNLLLH